MHSCLYEGWVWHRRLAPVEHRFRYGLTLLYLDLDELPVAFRGRWCWSLERFNVASFHRGDYLGDPRVPLAEAVRERVAEEGLPAPRGPIRLLTQPRHFGYLMNPVSFYFCFGADESLEAVVAEVTNTPWRERQSYVLRPGTCPPEARLAKRMHVSPFLPLEMEYGWQVTAPGERLRLDLANYRSGEPVFRAALRLRRRAWSAAALRRALWRRPLQAQQVAAAIYWQALRLWWQGCPVYSHPAAATERPAPCLARTP